MSFTLTQITQPSHEPLSLTDVKSFLRIVSTDQDDVISALITAARVSVEQFTRRIMVNQQWRLAFDRFPGSWPFSYGFGSSLISPYREIHIPLCPLVSVDSFQCIDMNTGDLVDVPNFQTSFAEPARLQPEYGQAWPIARWVLDAVQIQFTAGYGDTTQSPVIGVDPPQPLLIAMKLMIGHWYENRESQEMPKAAENLLQPYRVWDVSPVLNNWERFGR
jgi:uncharacterized phiE125 gp8 family phage protein